MCKGAFHPAPASFVVFDFNKPGVMEIYLPLLGICPKGWVRLLNIFFE